MTWKEFKDEAERQGVRDIDEISWIDIQGFEGFRVTHEQLSDDDDDDRDPALPRCLYFAS